MYTTHTNHLEDSEKKTRYVLFSYHGLRVHSCTFHFNPAFSTVDSRIAPMTMSNGVAWPNSKQGTLQVTSAKSVNINIATPQLGEMLIQGAAAPVPFALNFFNQPNYMGNKTFQAQVSCTNASQQFFDAFGNNVYAENYLWNPRCESPVYRSQGDSYPIQPRFEFRYMLNRPGA
ncbi:MAG: hypothetical protein ACFHU9_11980 [Fluviicola sp.]